MKRIALGSIEAYQRYISPRKGFVCAYRVHTGCASCSAIGWRAIRRYGVTRGLGVLRRRLYLCGVAYRRFKMPPARPPARQRGDCDCAFDLPCDLPCDGGGSDGKCGRILDCGSCDWPDRKRKRDKAREKRVYLPRRRKRTDVPPLDYPDGTR
jgi:putative component of membrane protein insertase Oxa1/YidC/SpoIIIJ protein YidD